MSACVYTAENEYLYLYIDEHHRDVLWWKNHQWKMRMRAVYANNRWHTEVGTLQDDFGFGDDPMHWFDIALTASQGLTAHQTRIVEELDQFQLDDQHTSVPLIFQQLLENVD